MPSPEPVLILGAGINGAALARELTLNGVGVVIVDQQDVASGATAASSRLIHGGLRYLEYREFHLVRESLAERTRLLKLAPQFVRPLRLFIPLDNRFGGLLTSARRFFGLKSKPPKSGAASRGLWPVRIGLALYDAYARDSTLPRRRLYSADSLETVPIDRKRFRWMFAYSDAQAVYPERFSLALLEDARRIAAQSGIPFRLLTYHRAKLDGRIASIAPTRQPQQNATSFAPSAIVNATGAWVDRTLSSLDVPSPRLIGGTKGSHFITYHPGLRDALAGRGIYVEAADGRPVFVLPFNSSFKSGTLVGTTDLVYDDDPAQAVASPEELQYLLDAVNALFSDIRLAENDVEMHYSGVRPLPYVGPQTPSAVTRRHLLQPNPGSAVPFYSVIGGKLTTCRSLAEESAATILARLGLPHATTSRDRMLPGGEAYPADEAALANELQRIAGRFHLPRRVVEAIWSLIGTGTEAVLAECGTVNGSPNFESIAGLPLPRSFIRWVIRNEWVTTLDDLVERRLMLLYHPNLSRRSLTDLAQQLVECDRIAPERIDLEVDATIERLRSRSGKRVSA